MSRTQLRLKKTVLLFLMKSYWRFANNFHSSSIDPQVRCPTWSLLLIVVVSTSRPIRLPGGTVQRCDVSVTKNYHCRSFAIQPGSIIIIIKKKKNVPSGAFFSHHEYSVKTLTSCKHKVEPHKCLCSFSKSHIRPPTSSDQLPFHTHHVFIFLHPRSECIPQAGSDRKKKKPKSSLDFGEQQFSASSSAPQHSTSLLINNDAWNRKKEKRKN